MEKKDENEEIEEGPPLKNNGNVGIRGAWEECCLIHKCPTKDGLAIRGDVPFNTTFD
jgi:hypothetical protein